MGASPGTQQPWGPQASSSQSHLCLSILYTCKGPLNTPSCLQSEPKHSQMQRSGDGAGDIALSTLSGPLFLWPTLSAYKMPSPRPTPRSLRPEEGILFHRLLITLDQRLGFSGSQFCFLLFLSVKSEFGPEPKKKKKPANWRYVSQTHLQTESLINIITLIE